MQATYPASRARTESPAREERRRSQRISLMVPLVVSGLSSRYKFAEYCKTLQINSYGCQIRLSRPLKAGTQVRLDIMDDNANRVATAHVVHSELALAEPEKDANFWNTGLALDRPGNIWGAPSPPEDWSAGDWSAEKPTAHTPTQPARMTAHPFDQFAMRPLQTSAAQPAASEMPSACDATPREGKACDVQQQGQDRRKHEGSLQRRRMAEDAADNNGRSDRDHERYPALFRLHQPDEPAAPKPDAPPRLPRPARADGEPTSLDRLQQDWQQTARAITARLEGVEARLEHVAAERDAESRASLQQAIGRVAGQVREQLERESAASRETFKTAFEADLERTLAPFVGRSQAATQDLQRVLDSLKEERSQLEAHAARLQQEKQQVQGWLVKETGRFHELIHEALIEASGQIKGQARLATEMAQEPVERRVLEAHTQIEELAIRKTEELTQRCELSLQRLDAVRAEAAHSIHAALDAQRAEMLERFQQQVRELTVASLAQMQSALNDALRSLSRVLQEKLDPASVKRPVEWGTGERRSTAA